MCGFLVARVARLWCILVEGAGGSIPLSGWVLGLRRFLYAPTFV